MIAMSSDLSNYPHNSRLSPKSCKFSYQLSKGLTTPMPIIEPIVLWEITPKSDMEFPNALADIPDL
jgi:hypothetical protein